MTDTETQAHRAAQADAPADKARQWMLTATTATLCTTCSREGLEGYPFGSVVPFAVMGDGRPVILIARIASHTANLRADPRASLFVQQPDLGGDPQRGWRLTLMGRWAPLTDPIQVEEAHARYVQRVPKAVDYLKQHHFDYWAPVTITAGRYIAGFGKICWLEGSDLIRDPQGAGLAAGGPRAIAHMNEDHRHNMIEMCRGHHGVDPESAEMVGLDRTGFLVRTTCPDRLLFFPFGREIGGDAVRHAVVDSLMQAREKLGSNA